MYQKIWALRRQVENRQVNEERAMILLGSILEQAGAEGNKDACLLAAMAEEKLPNCRKKDKEENWPLMDYLELLTWALSQKDSETIKQYLIGRHKDEGYTFDNMDKYYDEGIITEHFTPKGNLFIWFKDWWGEEGKPDGVINEVGYLGTNGKPKVISCDGMFDEDSEQADKILTIIKQLNERGLE